jgi:2'-5' RNA ligase
MKISLNPIIHYRKFSIHFQQKYFFSIRTSQDEKITDNSYVLPPKRYLTATDGLYKPNYFLSIPITDPSLITNYITYREHLLASQPSLFSLSSSHTRSFDPHHLHLTLLTLRLDSLLQIEQCIIALKRIQEEIHYHCSYPERICLEFNGIDTFYGKTLFMKCQQNIRLENLRTLIISRLCEQQQKQKMNEIFFAGNYQEFIPHITLFKNKRKFSLIYQNETSFGKQTIDALQLSSIGTNENEQQNTHCVFKLDLS